jgi:CBS domain-containing protein
MTQQVKNIMNRHPVCCTPEMAIRDVAKMMVEQDCGAIPVAVDTKVCRPVIGIVTDRDIVCRTIAQDKNPLDLRVKDCMSSSVATVHPDDSLEHCCDVMERLQVRRLPVVDQSGTLVGIVTQAHIAQNTSEQKAGEVVKNISKKTASPSRVSVGAQ